MVEIARVTCITNIFKQTLIEPVSFWNLLVENKLEKQFYVTSCFEQAVF